MIIETKYNIGDEVWFMESEKAVRAVIYGAETYVEATRKSVIYRTKSEDFIRHDKWESRLYSTKEELLNSL